jgi:hypothetical protein
LVSCKEQLREGEWFEMTLVLKKTRFTKGAIGVTRRLSVEEIEKRLGFNNIKPIPLTPSDEEDMIKKEDELKEWYEDELREFYEEAIRAVQTEQN